MARVDRLGDTLAAIDHVGGDQRAEQEAVRAEEGPHEQLAMIEPRRGRRLDVLERVGMVRERYCCQRSVPSTSLPHIIRAGSQAPGTQHSTPTYAPAPRSASADPARRPDGSGAADMMAARRPAPWPRRRCR